MGSTESKKGRIIVNLTVFVLLAVLFLTCTAQSVMAEDKPAAQDTKTEEKKTEDTKTEGEGFDSPKDAVLAYAEALKAQDMDALLSTFAVESVVENYDMMIHLANSQMVTPFSSLDELYPYGAGSLYELNNVEKRRSEITQQINNQILQLAMAEAGIYSFSDLPEDLTESIEAVYDDTYYLFDDSEEGIKEAKAYIEALTKVPDLTKIEIGEVLYAEGTEESYFTISNFQHMYTKAQALGADGYRSLLVQLKVGENMVLALMDTVKYGDKWYNYTPMANIAMLVGVSGYSGGIMIYDKTTFDKWDDAMKDYDSTIKEFRDYLNGDLADEWKEEHEDYMKELGVTKEEEIPDALKEQQTESFDAYILPIQAMTFEEAVEFFDLESV